MIHESLPSPAAASGAPRLTPVTAYLRARGVRFELVEHEPGLVAGSGLGGLPPHRVARTVVWRSGERFGVAAIPAGRALDLLKLGGLLETAEPPAPATPEEIAERFPGFHPAAVPPFDELGAGAAVVDRRLLDREHVLCPAGDLRHALLLRGDDLVRVAAADVADVCLD